MSFDQGEFNFDKPGNEAGWRQWRERLEERKREFESRWGVVLGEPVRLRLANHAKSIVGTIHWVENPKAPRGAPPRFRVRSLEFSTDEIESLVRID